MSGTATAGDPKTREQKLAQLHGLLEDFFKEEGGGLKTIKDQVKTLVDGFEAFKGVDIKAAVAEIEKLKAGHDKVTEQIRRSRGGMYVPGVEDYGKKFSIIRALVGFQTGEWKGAELEKEVVEEARKTKAAQAVGDDSRGGFFVPDQVIPDVIGAIYTRSAFVNLEGSEGTTRVSVVDGLTGMNVTIPKFEGGTIGYWVGEEDDVVESNSRVGNVTLNPNKLGVMVRITEDMTDFGGFGFENLLRQDMIRAAAKKIDHAVAYGPGGKIPRGIANTDGIRIYSAQSKKSGVKGTTALGDTSIFQADWQGAELDFDGLMNMELELEEDDIQLDDTQAKISAARFFKRLKQLKISSFSGQTTEKAYLLGMPMISNQRLMDLIGTWDRSNQIRTDRLPGASVGAPTTSTTAKFTDVFDGNLGEFLFGRWGGIMMKNDEGKGSGFAGGWARTRMIMRCDTACRQPRALILCPDARARD